MTLRKWLLAGAGFLALAACGGGEDEATETGAAQTDSTMAEVPDPAGMETAESEAAAAGMAASEAFMADNAARAGVEVTETGLQVETLSEGEGPSPTPDDYVNIHYVGQLMDGETFDSSVEREEPVLEPVEAFMPGLREALTMMSQGETARVVVPPELAFGATGTPNGMIGPNEAIVFDIELLEVIPAENQERVQELEQEAMARAEARFESLAAENAGAAESFLSENAQRDGIQVTESGLQYEVLEEGDGEASPVAEDMVEVHYRGTLPDGTEFDSSYARGEPATFPLNRVIAGWTEGLQLMSEGDKYRFYIPPALAYGEGGKGPIGPNQLLIFDVDLIDVREEAPGPAAGQGTSEPQ